MNKNDCIFCKIVAGKLPHYKIHENEDFLAFLDISQLVKGHTLVIPKKHYRFIWDIEDSSAFFRFAQRIANSFRQKGFKFVDCLAMGQMVKHAHLHLIPYKDKNNDWSRGLAKIESMQQDATRHPTPDEAEDILKEFKVE
jgi:histidine triad (HIT) family protein